MPEHVRHCQAEVEDSPGGNPLQLSPDSGEAAAQHPGRLPHPQSGLRVGHGLTPLVAEPFAAKQIPL